MAVKTKFFKSRATKKCNTKAKLPLRECVNMNSHPVKKEKRTSILNKSEDTSTVNSDRSVITLNREPKKSSQTVMDLKTKLMERMRLDDYKLRELRNQPNKLNPIKKEHKAIDTIKKEPVERVESLLDVLDAFIKENVTPVKREPRKKEKKKINKKIEPKIPNDFESSKSKSSFSFLEVQLPKSLLESLENSSSVKVIAKPSPPIKSIDEVNNDKCSEKEKQQEIYEKYNKRFYSDGLKIHKNPNFKYKTDIYGKPVIEKFENLPVIYSPIPERKYVTLEEFERVEYKLESIGKHLEFE